MKKLSLLLGLFWLPFTSQADINQAQQLFDKQHYEKALRSSNALLAKQPEHQQALFLKALSLQRIGRVDDAINTYQLINRKYPSLPEPYNNLAVLYAQKGQHDLARDALHAALNTHPSYSTAYNNLGSIYSKMAINAYNKALELGNQKKSAKTTLALIDKIDAPSSNAVALAKANAEKLAVAQLTVAKLAKEKESAEKLAATRLAKQKAAAAKLSAEILAREQAAAKLAKDKAEAEKLAAAKLAKERAEAKKLAAAKLAKEKAEAEKLTAAKLAKQKAEDEKLAAAKLAKEKAEAEKLAAAKLAKQKAEDEKLAAAKLSAEILAREQAAAKLAKEKAEAEKLAAAKLAKEKAEAEKLAAAKLAKEKFEAEKLAAAKLAKEKVEAEKLAAAKLAKAKFEAEKLAAAKLAKEKAAIDKLAAETLVNASQATEVERIIDTAKNWSNAWSSQDPETYLTFYADKFNPPKGLSRQSWEQQRRVRLRKPTFINVSIQSPKVELLSERTARLKFNQNYRSNRFQSVVVKTLLMEKVNGSWQILKEYVPS